MTRRVVFLLPILVLLAEADAHTSASPPPRTGQTTCSSASSEVPCLGSGQDGDTLAGVAWPVPRFVDNGDQTISDRLTGLTWTRNAAVAGGRYTWQQALDHVKALNRQRHLGHGDWRLPNVVELESLVGLTSDPVGRLEAQGYTDVQKGYYWSSTTDANCSTYAWGVGTYSGFVAALPKMDAGNLWPVRGGGLAVLNIPRTGQTACYDQGGAVADCPGTGQDGEFRSGASWPVPRFAAQADGTVRDELTGLQWPADGNTPGPAVCRPGVLKSWQDALAHIVCLNDNSFLGKREWRLPNRNELASLINRGEPNTALWLQENGFVDAHPAPYWSSTTYDSVIRNAWSVNMHDGSMGTTPKKYENYVLPVLSGYTRTKQ